MPKSYLFRSLAAAALVAALAWPGAASAVAVDLELVLAADISGSVSAAEFELQRGGYEAAFRDPAVKALIENGNGVAATLVYWSAADLGGGFSEGIQEQKVAWTLLTNGAQSEAFADAIAATEGSISVGQTIISGGQTAVADALLFSTALLDQANGFEGARELIDISGDGFENVVFNAAGCDAGFIPSCVNQGFTFGPPTLDAGLVYTNAPLFFEDVIAARDAAVGQGITINGLAITLDNNDLGSFFYSPHVTGGAGSFVLEASDFSADVFGEAIRSKLIAELPEPSLAVLLGLVALSAVARRGGRSSAKP